MTIQVLIPVEELRELPALQPDLAIKVTLANDKINYHIMRKGWLAYEGAGTKSLKETPSKEDILKEIEKKLSLYVRIEVKGDEQKESTISNVTSVWMKVRTMGKRWFDDFMTEELAKEFYALKEGNVISISSDDKVNWIPWELLCLSDDSQPHYDSFLGCKFVITNEFRPAYSDNPSPDVERRIKRRLMARSDNQPSIHKAQIRLVNIIGGNINQNGQIESLFSNLRNKYNCEVSTHQKPNIAKFNSIVANASIVHLTCHGHLDDDYNLTLQLGDSLSDELRTLDAPMVRYEMSRLNHAIVFANACNAALFVSPRGNTAGLAWAFYEKNAEVYISAMSLLPIKFAIQFAQDFYINLCQGLPVGNALHLTKINSLEKYKNPFFLTYSLFGNAFHRLIF